MSDPRLDTIIEKYQHKIGSIKEVRIDGILEKKVKWNGITWEPICRYPECKNSLKKDSKNLCSAHYLQQTNSNIKNEIITRINKSETQTSTQPGFLTQQTQRFKWNGKSWNLLCSNPICNNQVTNKSAGKCSRHSINENASMNVANIFQQTQELSQVIKQKNKKKYSRKKKETSEEEKKEETNEGEE